MTQEEFVADWQERYIKGTCTKEHLLRLQKINRLSEEEVQTILNSKESVEMMNE